MKHTVMMTLTFVMLSSSAYAGTDDFNQMIQENQKVQAELQDHLQHEAGIALDRSQPGAGGALKMTTDEVEQVVVTTSHEIFPDHHKRAAKLDDKKDMKRLSEELNQADLNF